MNGSLAVNSRLLKIDVLTIHTPLPRPQTWSLQSRDKLNTQDALHQSHSVSLTEVKRYTNLSLCNKGSRCVCVRMCCLACVQMLALKRYNKKHMEGLLKGALV